MQVINGSPLVVDATQATDKKGNMFCVMVAKGTYTIPEVDYHPLTIAKPDEQQPINIKDIFEGEIGLSTPYFENDWAFRKQRCDITLKGTAHSQKKTKLLEAGFRVANCKKIVTVTGYRKWKKGLSGVKAGEMAPFLNMPITYSRSYGGEWPEQKDMESICYIDNPIGCGFVDQQRRDLLDGETMPNRSFLCGVPSCPSNAV